MNEIPSRLIHLHCKLNQTHPATINQNNLYKDFKQKFTYFNYLYLFVMTPTWVLRITKCLSHHRFSIIVASYKNKVKSWWYDLCSMQQPKSHQSPKHVLNFRHHRGHGGGGNNHFRGNWFPPLHSQSYWQGGSKNGGPPPPNGDTAPLPTLQPQNETTGGPAAHHHQQQQQYQGRRSHNNNHHYHNGDGRKYRQNKGGKTS